VAGGIVTVRAIIPNGIALGKEYIQDFNIIFIVPKVITDIEIKTQPAKLVYAEGETLDLSGLVITLTYDDDTTEDVGLAGFKARGITASPAQGTALTVLEHNEKPVVVSAGGYSADTDKLTVSVVSVTGVTLDKTSASLSVGGTETLTAAITPANATNKNVTWSSSAPAVATVNASGLVTAVAAGSATITVTTADGNKTATCAVTVTATSVPVTGVTLDKTALTMLTIGGTEILTATVAPSNATNKAVTWSTSAPTVATVDTSGVVTAVAAGTAVITVTTADGNKTATCTVTVQTPSNKEARIGTKYYDTLNDALNDAANGTANAPTEIIILRNITAVQNGTNNYAYRIPASKNIKLNVEAGKNITITAAAGNFVLFSVSNNGSSLTLGPTADGGTLTLSGGNAAAQSSRGGVTIIERTFTMNDGVTITGFNSGQRGGGVFLYLDGTFTMNGGKISGNTASESYLGGGGGVFMDSGTFIMNGGEISDNTANGSNGGGGVCVSGTFTMNGGKILGNTASGGSNGGGGVRVTGTFTMNGGEISGNTASSYGGGVSAPGGTFNMYGGVINGANKAAVNGGGVYVSNGTFRVGKTAVISGNIKTGDSSANNVYLADGKYITLGTGTNAPATGMEIHVQTASADGVIVSSGGTEANKGYFVPDEAGKMVKHDSGKLVIVLAPFTNIPDFAAWLTAQPTNTAATAYNVKLNVSNLGGYSYITGSAGYTLHTNPNKNKYVNLDLSGSTFTSIGDQAFEDCPSLTSVTIPNSVTSIGDSAFSYCTSLNSVTIPNSVESIGRYAFYGCTSLNSVTIGNSVTRIGDDAFWNCTSLTSVTIGNNVTSIGEGAFAFCVSLTSVTIPNSVESIGRNAFSGCTSLNSVTIGNSVTRIGEEAFRGCTSLTSVTIPNSVESIGMSAFSGCTSLTSVTFATGSDIADADFGNYAFPVGSSGEGGNTLKTAYATGKAGTYTRAANGSTWAKE
jgi:uncharacterized protein YjdB